MSHNDDDWAVFWCSLLGPILLDDIPAGERRTFLKDLSQQEVLWPNGRRKRVSLSTLRRKVRQFRGKKIAGLTRTPRKDRGAVRKNRQEILARAIALKREQPWRSPHAINKLLEKEFGRTIPKATMNRHFRREGVTRKKLLVHSQPKIRCRWTREQTNALWVGDFADGPKVFHHGRAIKSHLSIWIDVHSRYVVEGRYYFKENLDILMDSLLRAWGSHGASLAAYVDNAKIYHANALKLACTQLNIQLLHRPPKDPPAGGIIERIIQTAQTQLESEVRAAHILTLDELNRYFQAWLHADYHVTPHRETETTPKARFEDHTKFRRDVNMREVLELFHVQEQRTVNEVFCDVQVANLFFIVDSKLRGDRVIVSYDPFSELEEVRLRSLKGEFLGVAKRYDREKGAHPDPQPEMRPPIDYKYLDLLKEQHEQLQKQAADGIDFHQAHRRHLWPFQQFAATFANRLGRKGGVSGLSTSELELLDRFHCRHPRITASLLDQAFQRAEFKTIPVVVFHLQNLLGERKD